MTVTGGDAASREVRVVGVAADGALLVAADGHTERLTSAEISLRPA